MQNMFLYATMILQRYVLSHLIFDSTQREYMRETSHTDKKTEKINAKRIAVAFLTAPITLIVFALGLLICLTHVGHMIHDDQVAGKLIAEFEEEASAFPPPATQTDTEAPDSSFPVSESNTAGEESQTDAEPSQTVTQVQTYTNVISPVDDAAGYIRIRNTNISYPVMYSEEEGYYLDHAANGSKNRNGAIYLAPENNEDFSDAINYVFGHNMTSGLMFRQLNDYLKKPGFLESHNDCEIVVDGVMNRYTLFFAESIPSDLEMTIYDQNALGSEVYKKYINALSQKTGYTLTENDRILVLITCTTGHRSNRTVVYGVSRE